MANTSTISPYFFPQKPTTQGGNGYCYSYGRLPKHDQRLADGAATVEGSDQCGLGTKRRVGCEKTLEHEGNGRNPSCRGVVWGWEVQG